MPMIPVDTAVQLIVGPLVDDTDFKTLETGVAYNAAGMSVDLIKSSISGTPTKTDLTLTTASTQDWVELGNGMYYIEITAAQNDTEGEIQLVGVATGILPFASPRYQVVSQQVYDSLVAGSDLLDVNASQLGGTAQTGNDVGADVNAILNDTGTDGVVVNWAAIVNPTATVTFSNTTVAVVSAVTGTVGGIAGTIATLDALDTAQDTQHSTTLSAVNTLTTRVGTPSDLGSGATVAANLVDIESQTDDIGALGAGLSAIPWNPAWDVEVQSEVADGLVAIGLDHLLSASVAGTDVTDGSVFARLVSSAATPDWDTYVNTTDSLQALRDNQIAATDIVTGGAIGTTGGAVDVVTATGTVTGNVDGSTGSVAGNVGGNVVGSVASVTGNVGGNVAGSVNSVATTVSADMVSISGSAPAADQLEAHALTVVAVTFTGGSTTTAVLGNVGGAAASSTDDAYNGRVLVFNAGTLARQVAEITDYVGSTKTATISAVTAAVGASHTAVLV